MLFVGRLVKEKGIIELMQALEFINSEIQLYVVGRGPLEDKVLSMGKKYVNFHYMGIIDNTRMPLYYSASDVVVVPSYEETLGRVGMESLACGTPVVATDNGGIREVVSNKVGILFKLSPKAIADAINKLYTKKAFYNMLKKNSRVHISKLYSPKNVEVFIKEYGLQ